MASRLDEQIDELYQLPLDQFTPRRNALAKELNGDARARVKALVKPSSAMWAVNQLYWHDRPTYNALVGASESLRSAHRALVAGRKADVRKPEMVHKAAVERALAKTTAIARASEGEPSAATLDTVRRTLLALPTDEQPGRLTRPPGPAGFSLLTGVAPRDVDEDTASRTARPTAAHPKSPDQTLMRQIQQAAKKRAQEEQAKRRAEAAAERKLAKVRAANERRLKSAREAAERAAAQLREAERRMEELERKK